MATWEQVVWQPGDVSGLPRVDRRSGPYRRYVPDELEARPLTLPSDLARRIATVERDIRRLNALGGENLASIARLLLRSEAIASSRIEGLAPSARQVALAELGDRESVRGVSAQARLVANNMTVVRNATTSLVGADAVTVDQIVALHRALLPDEFRHHGLREVQNWIGGSDWHPLGAEFVPPAPHRVPSLMADLVDYLNGAAHAPLVQAAVVHGQFETVHPFTDGNGRVGRALIHTVLTRGGLTPTAVLPISLVLATLQEQYVAGLTSYRYSGPPHKDAAMSGMRAWIAAFVEAAEVAVVESRALVDTVASLRGEWNERLSAHRASTGLRASPRADSAVARLLAALPEAAVLTARTVQEVLGVSHPAANAALDELQGAGILSVRSIERNTRAYLADEVLDLITHVERKLASTKFDTRVSAPVRPVPARRT